MRRRAFLLGLLAALAGPALADTASADFPRVLSHGLGETTIPASPERVATLGWIAPDVVLALGLAPVAVTRQVWGGNADGLTPWAAEALAAMGAPLPFRFDDLAIPYESLLMQEPDVILAPMSGLGRGAYARLSQIAPTLGWDRAPWTGDWQGITRRIGAALGREAEAEALVARTGARLRAAAAAHPEFAGVTFAIGSVIPAAATIGIHLGADPRVRLIEELGLRLAPSVRALPSGAFYTTLGLEALDRLDIDVLILWQAAPEDLEAMRAHPLFARFGPVARGCVLTLTDPGFIMALSAPSPLSIPWTLDRLVPRLAGTVADPACGDRR